MQVLFQLRHAGVDSDHGRSRRFGAPPREFADAYAVVQEAQQRAFEAVRPGVPADQIDKVARDIITHTGYGQYFVHRTGHGLGLEVHAAPYIVAGNKIPLSQGMVFSIEPGVYVPDRFGLRIEDIVVVTDRGCETSEPGAARALRGQLTMTPSGQAPAR